MDNYVRRQPKPKPNRPLEDHLADEQFIGITLIPSDIGLMICLYFEAI